MARQEKFCQAVFEPKPQKSLEKFPCLSCLAVAAHLSVISALACAGRQVRGMRKRD